MLDFVRARLSTAGAAPQPMRAAPLLELDPRWAAHVAEDLSAEAIGILHRHEASGRPLGSDGFLTRMEGVLGRVLRPRRRGPRKRMLMVN